nr:AraC family transcriptional regulator [Marinobacter salexigens]
MSLIDSGLARAVTQEVLAQRLGMSLSNLQRRFRAQYGVALGHYLRRYYLNMTREALIRDQITVETAAEMAGYTSAPNFATAFRREFKITPSQCRASARQLFLPGGAEPESDI